MSRSYIKVFRDEEKLQELYMLYEEGLSFVQLGKKFNVHHTSVMYQIQKYLNTGNVHLKNLKLQDRVVKRKKRTINSKIKCTKCELLYKSEFFCEYCKDKKISTVL